MSSAEKQPGWSNLNLVRLINGVGSRLGEHSQTTIRAAACAFIEARRTDLYAFASQRHREHARTKRDAMSAAATRSPVRPAFLMAMARTEESALNAANPSAPQAAHGPPGNLELTVQLDVGSASIRLDQLRSLQPGFIFEISASATTPVVARINGATIGRGELVRIGDHIGVRLLEVTQRER